MLPEPFELGDDCPICGHMTDTGAHELREIPGVLLPVIVCPSFAEFYMTQSAVVYDPDAAPTALPNEPLDENLHKSGNWRRLPRQDAMVEYDWCWRCSTRPVNLQSDPMCRDQIGVCGSCAADRMAIAGSRR